MESAALTAALHTYWQHTVDSVHQTNQSSAEQGMWSAFHLNVLFLPRDLSWQQLKEIILHTKPIVNHTLLVKCLNRFVG